MITEEDVRTVRSVDDLVAWIEDVKGKIDEPRTRKAFREEVVPLGLMLAHEENIPRDVSVSIPTDDGAADARLLDFRPDGTDQLIQITVASWDHNEELRKEYQRERVGISVNAFGAVTRDKETGKPQRSPCQYVSKKTIWCEYAGAVVERINKKQKKGKAYAEGTWLVVEIKDYIFSGSAVRGKSRHRTVSLDRSMSYGLFCPGTI